MLALCMLLMLDTLNSSSGLFSTVLNMTLGCCYGALLCWEGCCPWVDDGSWPDPAVLMGGCKRQPAEREVFSNKLSLPAKCSSSGTDP